MKYCHDSNCPGGVGTSCPSEYRDDIDRCPECGSILTTEAPVVRKTSQTGIGFRILVSTVAGVLLYWLQYVPLPGSEEIGWIDHWMGPIDLLVLPQSYGTILGLFVLVEVGAWAVPRWRVLRRTGVTGRTKLDRVTLYLAVGTAAIQTFSLATYLRSTGELGAWTPLLWLVTGAAATCGAFALVHWVERHGIGRGWSILVLVLCVDEIWTDVHSSMDQISGMVILVGSIALVLTLTTVWFLQANTSERSKWLPPRNTC